MSVVSRNAVPVRRRMPQPSYLTSASFCLLAVKQRVVKQAFLTCDTAHPICAPLAQLLPMQLARSFALRTESEVLRYLANAQVSHA